MERFSVRKPYTILVAVILVIVLGFVSLSGMQTDLLPQLSLPYMIIITTYPGASPERVEKMVSEPMESALGTITHVKNVYSVSSENYSMTQLEFEDGTDMDSAMVKVSSAVEQASQILPEGCGTPAILEISMDMVATMYTAVSRDGYDRYELSDYVDQEVRPYLERQDGVASVSGIGLVEKSVLIELNREKIDDLNERILKETDSSLKKAGEELDKALKQVEDGQKALEEQEKSFGEQVASGIFSQIDADELTDSLKGGIEDLIAQLEQLSSEAEEWGSSDIGFEVVPGLGETLAGAQEDFEAALDSAENNSDILDDASEEAALEVNQAVEEAAEAMDAGTSLAESNAQTYLADAVDTLRDASDSLDGNTVSSLTEGTTKLMSAVSLIENALYELRAIDLTGALDSAMADVEDSLAEVSGMVDTLPEVMESAETAVGALFQGQLDAAVGFAEGTRQLAEAQAQLKSAQAQYDAAKENALKNANVDSLVSAATLSGLIYAQNFEMPAGYIDDRDDNTWLLKVGDEYEGSSEIADALLADIDGIGTIRLSDVADITVIDNADKSFTNVNGDEAVVLAVFKSSTAGTNEVSRNCEAAMRELEEEQPGTHLVNLMDQGKYITMIVQDILKSMGVGALLAIVILALFLRDIRPTVMVGISIPLSVLFTIVLMYFTGLSMNIMTLGGISLGIGMLVDNSIVVMENVIRLRQRGVSAAGASVQGARQVSGAIVSSTLTTVCVFVPMVFTEGTVRSLLVPMALSITYCLVASYIVALTVIPASASVILRKVKPKKRGLFDRVLDIYERILRFCLRVKAVPLLGSAILLALCIAALIRMGIVILPEMSSDTLQMTIVTPEEYTREESYAEVSDIIGTIMEVSGLTEVGTMDSSGTLSLLSGMGGDGEAYGSYICYLTVEDGADSREVKRILNELTEAVSGYPGEVTVSAGGMSDMSALLGSGLSVNIYGSDLDQIREISSRVAEAASGVSGFTQISDGTEEDEKALHLVIDKDKAMSYGLTVAQIYTQIAARTQTQVTSTGITENGLSLDVLVRDETDVLTVENLLEMEFDASSASSGMSGASSGDMSAMAGMMGGDMSSMAGMMGGDMSAMAGMTGTDAGTSDVGSLANLFGGAGDTDEEEEEDKGESEENPDDGEESSVHKLKEFAYVEETTSPSSISRENQKRYMTVTAQTDEGMNTTLLVRELQPALNEISASLPNGYSVELSGETTQVKKMVTQMSKMLALALSFIYFVMVAQFQSLLSPFIILFTVPLAFTGGMIGLLIAGEQLSMMSIMGFLVLMGTVVNNGIVFVDYVNQLRIGGLSREDALIATGRTRMRPILMTAMTTILAMAQLIFGTGMGSQMSRGMAIVIAGGLAYATLMTLFIIPVMYDILYKRQPLAVEVDDSINDIPDDAAEFLAERNPRED